MAFLFRFYELGTDSDGFFFGLVAGRGVFLGIIILGFSSSLGRLLYWCITWHTAVTLLGLGTGRLWDLDTRKLVWFTPWQDWIRAGSQGLGFG